VHKPARTPGQWRNHLDRPVPALPARRPALAGATRRNEALRRPAAVV